MNAKSGIIILVAMLCIFLVGAQPVSAGIHKSGIYADYGFSYNKLQTLKNDLTMKKSNRLIIEAYLFGDGGSREGCLLHFYVKDRKGKVLIKEENYTLLTFLLATSRCNLPYRTKQASKREL